VGGCLRNLRDAFFYKTRPFFDAFFELFLVQFPYRAGNVRLRED
jgi:hypothetical protein